MFCTVMEAFVDQGADLNARDFGGSGRTVLFYAMHGDVIRTLVRLGAICNAIDVFGQTALFDLLSIEHEWGMGQRPIEIAWSGCKALLDAGIDKDIKNQYGNTALYYLSLEMENWCAPFVPGGDVRSFLQ